ncbi:hypothetical protein LCGC14_2953690, partial [marine sediment metagenome]
MTETSGQNSPGKSASIAAAPPVGSLADMVAAGPEVSFRESFPPATLIKIGVLAALLVVAHLSQLEVLVRKWINDTDWTYGFAMPLFSIYLIYNRREELYATRRRRDLWNYVGLAIAVAALVAQPLCVYPIRNHWLMQICMVMVLFGIVLFMGGSKVIRVTWLPILFLLLALPISPGLYTKISLPLQETAAKGAVVILRVVGIDINSTASALTLTSREGLSRNLTVAEACNGMRLLTAFLALGVATAYLDDKPIWQRVILVISAVPIAIFCNVIRVSI